MLVNDIRQDDSLPNVTKSPILDVIHDFDSPRRREGRSRDRAPDSEE
jgi:hypothetical protein